MIGDETRGYAELRRILVGDEAARLEELENRIVDLERRKADVGEVLPGAISGRLSKDGELVEALTPVVESTMELSIRRSPQRMGDALFPMMGPAIRRAVANALAEVLQRLNRAVEHNFSVQGLRWRLEAARTGVPFAEVVLRNTLVYRVEQVFLIEPKASLLLAHAARDEIVADSPDLVSGMLTVVQDFVQDSFRVESGDSLDSLRVGDLTVWVEPGPLATLAAVIRGEPPVALHGTLQEVLAEVHSVFGSRLADFDGDTNGLAGAVPILERCLGSKSRMERQRVSPRLVIAAALLVVALGLVSFWQVERGRRWQHYLTALETAPGIVVTGKDRAFRTFEVSGLRDPLATDPVRLAESSGLDPARIDALWEAYLALHPELVLERSRQALDPPPGVVLSVDRGLIRVQGVARRAWIDQAHRLLPALAGPGGYEIDVATALE